jgi:hypothetical protein
MLPVSPVLLLKEAAAGQVHDEGGVVADVTRVDNVVALDMLESGGTTKEFNTIIELVMQLGKVLLGHIADTSVRNVGRGVGV